MSKSRKNSTWFRRFFSSPLFLVFGVILACMFAFAFLRSYYQDYHIRREITTLKKEVDSLEKSKLESLDVLDYVMSDAFVEETARKELHYRNPGEQVLVVNTPTIYDELEVGIDQAGRNLRNPIKWWYYFTHKEVTSEES